MSNWLSELTTRAVSVLEDVDQLAAESLSTSPGDRIKRRVELRAARRKAKSSEPPAASEPAAAAAATASGQAEAASEASGEETQGEAKAEARTPAAQRSTARVPAEVNNGSHEPLVRENALLKSEISSLEEEIAALAERLRTAQEALAESRAALATAERSLSDARREKQQTAVELRALQRREEEAVQAKRRLQTQLDEAQAQLQAQQAHVQGQASASAQQQPQTEITQHADSQSLLARDDAQLRDRLAVVEAELQAAKAERDDFQRQTEDQQSRLLVFFTFLSLSFSLRDAFFLTLQEHWRICSRKWQLHSDGMSDLTRILKSTKSARSESCMSVLPTRRSLCCQLSLTHLLFPSPFSSHHSQKKRCWKR